MLIGVPKEIKNHENRVGMAPASVREAIKHGHQVLVQANAGAGIGVQDADYASIGAEIVDDAAEIFARAELVVRKGFDPAIDSYSAFYENDHETPTGLSGYLRTRGFQRIFAAGLATDFCVHYSAVDAAREGFPVVVLEDACRAIDLEGSLAAARAAMQAAGVVLATAAAIAA